MVGIKRVSVIAAVAALSCSSAVAQGSDSAVSLDASLTSSVAKNLSLSDLSVGEVSLPQLPITLTPQEVVEQLELYLLKSDVILGQFDMPALGSFLPAMPGLSFPDMIDCQLQIPLVGDLAEACESLRPTLSSFFTQRLSNGLQVPVQQHLGSIIDATAVKTATDALEETLGSITSGSLGSITGGSLGSITGGSLGSIRGGSVAESLEALTGKGLASSGSVTVEAVAESTRSALDNVDSSFREAGEKLVTAGESFVDSLDETTNSLASHVGATGGLGAVRQAVVGRLRGTANAGEDALPILDLNLPELPELNLAELDIPEVAANLSFPSGEDVVRAIEEAGLTLPSTQIIDEILRSGDKEPLLAARSTLEEFLRSTNQIILDGARDISEAGRILLEVDEVEEEEVADDSARRLEEDVDSEVDVQGERRLAEAEAEDEAEEGEAARALEEVEVDQEAEADRRLEEVEAEVEAEVADRRLDEEAEVAEAEIPDRRLDAEEAEAEGDESVLRTLQAEETEAEATEEGLETPRALQEEEAEDDENVPQ